MGTGGAITFNFLLIIMVRSSSLFHSLLGHGWLNVCEAYSLELNLLQCSIAKGFYFGNMK